VSFRFAGLSEAHRSIRPVQGNKTHREWQRRSQATVDRLPHSRFGNTWLVLLSLFLVCFVALALTTVLLLLAGHRLRVASRLLGAFFAIVIAIGSGEIAAAIWRLETSYVWAGEAFLLFPTLLVVMLRRRWNPLGQVFYGSFLASTLAYLAFAIDITFASGLSAPGMAASAALLLLELVALFLAASFAFESLDVLCRTRWDRPNIEPRPHVPAEGLPSDRRLQRTARHADRNDRLGRGNRLSEPRSGGDR
jgi:hypothetical protein